MVMSTKVSGVWRGVGTLYTKVSGTWRVVQTGYVKISGVWRVFHSNSGPGGGGGTLSMTWARLFNYSPGQPSNVSISMLRNGDVSVQSSVQPGANDWITPRSSSIGTGYHCRLIVNSGSNRTSGENTGVWLSLASNRTWNWTQNVPGTRSANCTMQLSADGGATIAASHTFDVDAEYDNFDPGGGF